MPVDDRTFSADADAANEALRVATSRSVTGFAAAAPEVDLRLQRFRAYRDYFKGIGNVSGGSDLVVDAIKSDVPALVAEYDQSHELSPVGAIVGQLSGWNGRAARRFKYDYLKRLATSLENQYATLMAMSGAMKTYGGIVDQARQQYLDLVDSTTVLIDENTAIRRGSSPSISVGKVVTDITTGVTIGAALGGIPGLVAGTVAGAISAASPAIDERLSDLTGDSWFSITDNSLEKMDSLAASVQEDALVVVKALNKVLDYVDGGKLHDYLVPPVGKDVVHIS